MSAIQHFVLVSLHWFTAALLTSFAVGRRSRPRRNPLEPGWRRPARPGMGASAGLLRGNEWRLCSIAAHCAPCYALSRSFVPDNYCMFRLRRVRCIGSQPRCSLRSQSDGGAGHVAIPWSQAKSSQRSGEEWRRPAKDRMSEVPLRHECRRSGRGHGEVPSREWP